jgi:hypothetical protein
MKGDLALPPSSGFRCFFLSSLLYLTLVSFYKGKIRNRLLQESPKEEPRINVATNDVKSEKEPPVVKVMWQRFLYSNSWFPPPFFHATTILFKLLDITGDSEVGSHVTGWRLTIYRAYLLAQLIYLQFLKVQKFFRHIEFFGIRSTWLFHWITHGDCLSPFDFSNYFFFLILSRSSQTDRYRYKKEDPPEFLGIIYVKQK